jgi:small nuclear ribonucleoprotein (snRNP)-like protein
MKTINAATVATFSELLDLAEDETVLVTTSDGREFIVAEIDDFDQEVEAASQSRELMELLAERSKEKAKGGHSLAEVKKRLGLD